MLVVVVQGSCSVLHNDALGFSRDIGCSVNSVSVTSGSIGSAIFGKGLVVFCLYTLLYPCADSDQFCFNTLFQLCTGRLSSLQLN